MVSSSLRIAIEVNVFTPLLPLSHFKHSVSESPTGFPDETRFNSSREVHRCRRFHSPPHGI